MSRHAFCAFLPSSCRSPTRMTGTSSSTTDTGTLPVSRYRASRGSSTTRDCSPSSDDGGRATPDLDEIFYRFDFPERAGALRHFLARMGSRFWNISMFSCRNHGSACGRVLNRLRTGARNGVWSPQPRLRLRLRSDGPAGVAGRAGRLPVVSRRCGVRVPGGDGGSGAPAVSSVRGRRAPATALSGAEGITKERPAVASRRFTGDSIVVIGLRRSTDAADGTAVAFRCVTDYASASARGMADECRCPGNAAIRRCGR